MDELELAVEAESNEHNQSNEHNRMDMKARLDTKGKRQGKIVNYALSEVEYLMHHTLPMWLHVISSFFLGSCHLGDGRCVSKHAGLRTGSLSAKAQRQGI
jgi:hypothetical protein